MTGTDRRSQLVCVTGADGSGKSTLIRVLAEGLVARGRSVAVVSVWDLYSDQRVRDVFRSRALLMDYLAALSPMSRCYFLLHALRGALDGAPPADVLLLDAYWYKYMAGEAAHGVPPRVLLGLVQDFPRPDSIWYLNAPTELAAERKPGFSAYETGFADASREAFIAFQEKLKRHLLEFARNEGVPLIHLDPLLECPEQLARRIVAHLCGAGS
jgi:dTMP kinase